MWTAGPKCIDVCSTWSTFPIELHVTETDSLNALESENQSLDDALLGKRVALVGRFGGMNRREAANLVRSYNATIVNRSDPSVDWIVIGADEPPLAEADLLSQDLLDAAASGSLEILNETDLWQRLGLVDPEQAIRRYYTPAMLAHLLGVSIRVIRRWQRSGLITPVRTLHRLPYFDFQEVATARRLAQWIASGASPKAIEQRLVDLVNVLPGIQRPLDQLSILVEGKRILLRQGAGLLEMSGQLHFDFDAMDNNLALAAEPTEADEAILSFPSSQSETVARDELLAAAFEAEDDDDLEVAIDYCHAILARDGIRADICFHLAELLYRLGHTLAARERYYAAIEVEPDFVEARAGLGNVLAETGQLDLAIAAFQGVLSIHDDYAEVHFSLAQTLDKIGKRKQAQTHWERFLELSPDSPWRDEVAERVNENATASTEV
ncbi:MAG: tetratricopeptide repeat protein [Pirellulaceae bacterium]|nr:tetratricopeptide repeat protein [Pirellulaceae bacterium]